MPYRLGLDIGTNSIGWWRYELKDGVPVRSLGGGVRIYSDGRDPQDKTSLAVARRLGRSMRRRRDRYLRRRAKLLRAFIDLKFLPEDARKCRDLVLKDPYELRAAALDRPLSPAEIGRLLFHLNQRRGFQSNRKTDRADSERGVVRQGVKRLQALLEEAKARTLGEFLYKRHKSNDWVRARKRPMPNDKGKMIAQYDIYPDRAMVMEEFEKIWAAQTPRHPGIMTGAARSKIKDIIFFQRRLKPVQVGLCTFNPKERRLPWADPLSQRRRVYEQANQLRIVTPGKGETLLEKSQRDQVTLALLAHPKRTFSQLRRLLKLTPDQRFNLESERRTELKGDETAAALSKPEYFGDAWRAFPMEKQREIVKHLIDEEDEQKLALWLMTNAGLDADHAMEVSLASLSDGYASLGETASRAIFEELEKDVVVYSEAARRAGYNHSDQRTGEILDELPYYGYWLEGSVVPGTGDPEDDDATRYGRIANPTVHIGMGQLRRVVNAVIDRWGQPDQIVVELARELKASQEQQKARDKQHTANRKRAEEHRKILADLGQQDTGETRLRLRLFDELTPLEHRCPYSGKQISLAMLFTNTVEVDHILPFSKTLDNRVDNRILVMSESNRQKGNRSPYEAFGSLPQWSDIAARAEKLPGKKRRRFQPDAMEWFLRDEKDFLDRHLVDTQYLGRIAKRYLEAVCDPNQVWAIPGTLTGLVRGKWRMDDVLGSNLKNRNDHRHHALDAAIIGLIDRGLLQKVARESARSAEMLGKEDINVPMPWDGLKEELRAHIREIVVSHKPEHGEPGTGRVGKFFKETAYGITDDVDARGVPLALHRVPLESLKSAADLDVIHNPDLRRALQGATVGKEGDEFIKALLEFREKDGPYKGLRRVRIAERVSVTPIKDKNGKVYKGYASGGNFSFTVWRLPNGKWQGEIVSLHAAAQGVTDSAIRNQVPTAKKMMTLRQRDLIAIEDKEGRRIMVVQQLSATGQIVLVEHCEAGNLAQRTRDKDDHFSFFSPTASGLQKSKARKVRADPSGKLYDPGHLE